MATLFQNLEKVYRSDAARPPLTVEWRLAIQLLISSVVAVLILFWRDVFDMARIAWNISTYNHILLIPPIVAWLVSQRVPELLKLTPRRWAPGLVLIAGAAILWILGQAASLSVARHLALIVMLQGCVVAMLGPQVARGLLFPLLYAFFLLPIGEEIVPFLQTVTADISMALLGWSGIPAHIEGVFISTPTGYFEVAEACSGVMFLIAMLAYGALVANVCFNSWLRRALFMLLCVAVPILANGVRAWGTMYIAHYTGIEFAAGFDHILYGWIFFAVVLAIVMAIGWRFFDRSIDDPMIDATKLKNSYAGGNLLSSKITVGGIFALIALPVLWSLFSSQLTAKVPNQIYLPPVSGWERVDYEPSYPWQPKYKGANHTLLGRYTDGRGAYVDVSIALYDGQEEGREMTGYAQGAHDPESEWSWTANGDVIAGGKSDILVAPGPVVREALTFYKIGDVMTGSATNVKLEIMKSRLTGSAVPSSAIIISAENSGNMTGRTAINRFMDDIGPVDKWADQIVAVR